MDEETDENDSPSSRMDDLSSRMKMIREGGRKEIERRRTGGGKKIKDGGWSTVHEYEIVT
jgi:ketosteroid isomerase-like protein